MCLLARGTGSQLGAPAGVTHVKLRRSQLQIIPFRLLFSLLFHFISASGYCKSAHSCNETHDADEYPGVCNFFALRFTMVIDVLEQMILSGCQKGRFQLAVHFSKTS